MTRIGKNLSNPKEIQRKGNLFVLNFQNISIFLQILSFKSYLFFEFCKVNLRSNSGFNNVRYFFSWRPIKVSPIGVHNFFSSWGLRVIKSELIWIGIPSFILILGNRIRKKLKNKWN